MDRSLSDSATLRELALEAYDKTIGLQLSDVVAVVDCCITKAPCGGEKAGRNPVVDRAKQGIKRSTLVVAKGIPLGVVAAPANRHDSLLLLDETLDTLGALGELPEQMSVHLATAAAMTLVVSERS